MRAQLQYMEGHRGRVVPLGEEPVLVGGRTAAIQVPNSNRARQHARICKESDSYWIEDLGGDGVWVNDQRIQRLQLVSRDRLRVGTLWLEYFEEP